MKILNETKYAKNILEKGFDQNKFSYDLKILAKYLYKEEKDELKLKEKLISVCKEKNKNFNEVKYWKLIKYACEIAKKYELFDVEPVGINEFELDTIENLHNLKIQKIAFVLLVLAKLNKQYYILNSKNKESFDNGEYYVNSKISEIFNLAKIYLKKKEKDMIFNYLIEKEYIQMTKKCNYKINFVYPTSKKNVIMIDDFDNFILEYERLLGDNIGNCEKCNKPIRITSNKTKYCNKCAVEAHKETKLNNWHKNKEKYRMLDK